MDNNLISTLNIVNNLSYDNYKVSSKNIQSNKSDNNEKQNNSTEQESQPSGDLSQQGGKAESNSQKFWKFISDSKYNDNGEKWSPNKQR